MPELLDEIMDETAALMDGIAAIRGRVKDGGRITEAELVRLKRAAARIVNMLRAVEAEH
jgi:hypothetical protein